VNRRPNQPFQPTLLRVDKVGRMLEIGSGSMAISIYWCGAAEWQAVRRITRITGRSPRLGKEVSWTRTSKR
jgi:hypothetical protein